MIALKLIGGIFLIIVGILLFINNKKFAKKEDETIEVSLYKKSIVLRGYLFSFILIFCGLVLIISCFHQSSEPQVIDDGKVIIWR